MLRYLLLPQSFILSSLILFFSQCYGLALRNFSVDKRRALMAVNLIRLDAYQARKDAVQH